MGKVETLEKIEREIAEGKLGIARDRLHGLSLTYPEDVSLRSRQGDIYSQLGLPIEAGRCWILDDEPNEEKTEAVDAFLRSCNNHPVAILKRLKVRCDPQDLSTITAQQKIEELFKGCKKRGRKVPEFRENFGTDYPSDNLAIFGGVALLIIVLIIFGVGVVASFNWIKSLWN